jgi:hypothetical protein
MRDNKVLRGFKRFTNINTYVSIFNTQEKGTKMKLNARRSISASLNKTEAILLEKWANEENLNINQCVKIALAYTVANRKPKKSAEQTSVSAQ